MNRDKKTAIPPRPSRYFAFTQCFTDPPSSRLADAVEEVPEGEADATAQRSNHRETQNIPPD
jgi:hypothetical protein